MEQTPRILEHDAGLLALLDQLRNELAHSLVAPVEDGRVVIVADVGVVHHVLEVADDLCRVEVTAPGRDERLLHVEGVGKQALGLSKIDSALGQIHRA